VQSAGTDAAQRLAETLTRTLDEAVRAVGDEVVQNLRALHSPATDADSTRDRRP
jgi:hypothetical protein